VPCCPAGKCSRSGSPLPLRCWGTSCFSPPFAVPKTLNTAPHWHCWTSSTVPRQQRVPNGVTASEASDLRGSTSQKENQHCTTVPGVSLKRHGCRPPPLPSRTGCRRLAGSVAVGPSVLVLWGISVCGCLGHYCLMPLSYNTIRDIKDFSDCAVVVGGACTWGSWMRLHTRRPLMPSVLSVAMIHPTSTPLPPTQ